MKVLLPAILAFLMALIAVHGQGQFSFNSSSTYQQLPEYPGGSLNCSGPVSWADDFKFPQNTSVERVTWWSKTAPIPSQLFLIQFLSDGQGAPGIALADYEVQITATDQVGIGGIEHRFTTTLPSPLSAQSDVPYWLRIYSLDDPHWTWSIGRSANQPWDVYAVDGGKWVMSWGTDLAFALNIVPDIVPEPKTLVLLPLALASLLGIRPVSIRAKMTLDD